MVTWALRVALAAATGVSRWRWRQLVWMVQGGGCGWRGDVGGCYRLCLFRALPWGWWGRGFLRSGDAYSTTRWLLFPSSLDDRSGPGATLVVGLGWWVLAGGAEVVLQAVSSFFWLMRYGCAGWQDVVKVVSVCGRHGAEPDESLH